MSVIDTGRVFEIYSMGDGVFMRRVIDSVAAMSNTGLLLQLVGFGLLLGLLIMGFRNVMAGGTKLDLGTTLVAMILGGIMFGLKADVIIHDMNFAPGEIDQPTYRVDNVPFGIAAAGYLISGTGYFLTEQMETGYGLYSGGRSTLIEGGFGNTLEWINAIRMWEVPTFNDSSGVVGRFRENLGTYVNECTLPAIEMGHLRYDAILKSQQLYTYGDAAGNGGFGYQSEYLMFEYTQADSTKTTVTCRAGFQSIANDSMTVMPAFASAVARSKLDMSSSGADAQGAMEDAYTTVGLNNQQMQDLVLAEAVGLSLHNAVSGKTTSTALSTQTKMMVEQASLQRAVQWAAEETMFRRVMRPMMAFFESLIYALAPFMAIMIGMGSFGFQTVMKYMMLSIWVVLWLPMLSIIQLYQVTMMQHGVAGIQTAIDGVSGGVGMSVAGADQMRSLAIDWLGSGAAMAAFTPALTMMLVWGGGAAASALAGRMQGGDQINEKTTAPDVTNTPPAIASGSAFESSRVAGMTAGGSQASLPTINMSSASEWGVSSANSQLASAQAQYATAVSNVLSATESRGRGVSSNASVDQSGFASSTDMGSFRTGANAASDESKRAEHATAGSSSQAATSSLDSKAGVGIPADISPISAGASMSGSNRDTQELQDALRSATGSGRNLRTDAGFNQGWDGSAGQRLQEAVGRAANSNAELREALAKSSEVRAAEQAIAQAQRSYQESASFSSRFGAQQNVPINQLAAEANREGRAGDLQSAVVSSGLADRARDLYARMGNITDRDTRATAANIAALYEGAQNGTRGGVSQEMADFRRTAFTDAMSGQVGAGGFMGGAVRPDSNQGVGDGAPAYDDVVARGSAAGAPATSAAKIHGEVSGALRGDSGVLARMDAEARDAVPANPGGYGSLPATAGHNAGAIASDMAVPAMGVVMNEANQNIAEDLSGMGASVMNAASSDGSIDTKGRIEGASIDRFMGSMPESIEGGSAASARADTLMSQNSFMSRELANAIAVGEVIENNGAGAVTQAEYDAAKAFVGTPAGEALVHTYGDKQHGAAMRAEAQAIHEAGGETYQDKVNNGTAGIEPEE